MDIFSHALWGYGVFGHRGHPWLALIFGAMPDLLAFSGITIYQLVAGTFVFGAPELETIPAWCFYVYDFNHSLIMAGICVSVMYVFKKGLAFVMLAWPFHILLDFPFHAQTYFPTKLFWPITDFSVNGIPWNEPWIWFPNLAGIIIILIYRRLQRKKRIEP